MKFRPVGERALVKPVEQEMTASGIVLPHAPRKKPRSARVVAVGRFENGARVDEGDVVGFANWIPDSDDLLGVVEEVGEVFGVAHEKPGFGTDACRSIEAGVNKPASVARATLGPKSRYVDERGYSVRR